MTFLDQEKAGYIRYKAETPHLSPAARRDGVYRGRPRPFCLPRECAEENLFAGIPEGASPETEFL